MKVKVQKLTDNAKLPSIKHDSDFCYDLVATKRTHKGLFFWEYEVGLAMQIDRTDEVIEYGESIRDFWGTAVGTTGYKGISFRRSPIKLSLDIRPRSSIKDTGLVLCNSEGTIDEEYTGPIKFYFYHVLPWKKVYKVGDRIGQIKLGFTLPIDFEWVDKLNDTERGNGGFGSTGK